MLDLPARVDVFTVGLISKLVGESKGRLLSFSTWGGVKDVVQDHPYHCFSIPKYYGVESARNR